MDVGRGGVHYLFIVPSLVSAILGLHLSQASTHRLMAETATKCSFGVHQLFFFFGATAQIGPRPPNF
jgi:hypothetical protein